MRPRETWTPILLAALLLAAAPGVALAGQWALYGGVYDTDSTSGHPTELGLEHRFGALKIPKVALSPAVGIAGTDDGNVWGYGGLRLDLTLGRWVITPQFAVSLYDAGDGKDLGGEVEFRSGLEVAYDFAKGPKVGLLFYHLSNADVYDFNPGSNSLVLTLAFGD